jgi:hypothetical protein
MGNPLDEALMAKEALNFGSMLGQAGQELGSSMLHGATGALGAAAMVGVGVGAQKLISAGRKRHDFKEMMELNPDLAPHQEGNPRFFNASYSSIRRLNPTYGRDPIVAGSLMRRMMESPESAGTILTGTLKEPSAPGASTTFGVSGNIGPLSYRHDF